MTAILLNCPPIDHGRGQRPGDQLQIRQATVCPQRHYRTIHSPTTILPPRLTRSDHQLYLLCPLPDLPSQIPALTETTHLATPPPQSPQGDFAAEPSAGTS